MLAEKTLDLVFSECTRKAMEMSGRCSSKSFMPLEMYDLIICRINLFKTLALSFEEWWLGVVFVLVISRKMQNAWKNITLKITPVVGMNLKSATNSCYKMPQERFSYKLCILGWLNPFCELINHDKYV